MFAVSSVEAAKAYYQELQDQQAGKAKPLKIATIFSYAANEEQAAIGEIDGELDSRDRYRRNLHGRGGCGS